MHNQTPYTEQNTPNPLGPNNAYALSPKPQKAMQEMMDTIDELRAVYVRETEALKSSDAKLFMSLQDEKLGAARKYQSRISQILARSDEMKTIDPELRTRLVDMQSDFSKLAEENMEALERMNRCMGALGNKLQKAAADVARKKRTFAYTSNGLVNTDEAKSISTGTISETA